MRYDFYTGFEGEPELIVEGRAANGQLGPVRVWMGYFNELMDRVPPAPSGWTGLALHHHLYTGWNEEPEWIDPDPVDSVLMLAAARVGLPEGVVREMADSLLTVIGETIARGGAVAWRVE